MNFFMDFELHFILCSYPNPCPISSLSLTRENSLLTECRIDFFYFLQLQILYRQVCLPNLYQFRANFSPTSPTTASGLGYALEPCASAPGGGQMYQNTLWLTGNQCLYSGRGLGRESGERTLRACVTRWDDTSAHVARPRTILPSPSASASRLSVCVLSPTTHYNTALVKAKQTNRLTSALAKISIVLTFHICFLWLRDVAENEHGCMDSRNYNLKGWDWLCEIIRTFAIRYCYPKFF